MTPTEARERFWRISRIDENSPKGRSAREAFMRDMEEEAAKSTPNAEWFKRSVTTYAISEFADLIKYRGPNTEIRGHNLLADLIEWAELPPGFKLHHVGRTVWEDYPPAVEKRKKNGEYVLTCTF